MTREYTKMLLKAMDDGILDPKELVEGLVLYMSEDEVRDFGRTYDLALGEDVDNEEEGDPNDFN